MKKIVWLFSLLLVVVAAGMLYGQGTATLEPQFVMIQWSPHSGMIYVYKGPGTDPETIKCKGGFSQNCFLELLGQYKSKGYRFVSATEAPYLSGGVERVGQAVVLEKQ